MTQTKIIEFAGHTYRQLTFKEFWTDCEFDVLDSRTGEWVPVSASDLIWLYDDGWQAEYYRAA